MHPHIDRGIQRRRPLVPEFRFKGYQANHQTFHMPEMLQQIIADLFSAALSTRRRWRSLIKKFKEIHILKVLGVVLVEKADNAFRQTSGIKLFNTSDKILSVHI